MSNRKPSSIPLRMRYLAIILGMVFFLWVPYEDTSAVPTILFSILICFWVAIAFLARQPKPFEAGLVKYVLVGTLAGIAITPLTLVLMVLKTGLHGHSAPDFTPQEFISAVRRTPIWMIGGFFIGLGSGIWLTNRHQP